MKQSEQIKTLRRIVSKLFDACMIARQPLDDSNKLLTRDKNFWLRRMKDAKERSGKRMAECFDEYAEMYSNEIKK